MYPINSFWGFVGNYFRLEDQCEPPLNEKLAKLTLYHSSFSFGDHVCDFFGGLLRDEITSHTKYTFRHFTARIPFINVKEFLIYAIQLSHRNFHLSLSNGHNIC